jgi:hypothetical protein
MAAMESKHREQASIAKLQPRTSRDEGLLREVRSRLSRNEARLRRLERMEQAARVWVNGHEVGEPRYAHLSDVDD